MLIFNLNKVFNPLGKSPFLKRKTSFNCSNLIISSSLRSLFSAKNCLYDYYKDIMQIYFFCKILIILMSLTVVKDHTGQPYNN